MKTNIKSLTTIALLVGALFTNTVFAADIQEAERGAPIEIPIYLVQEEDIELELPEEPTENFSVILPTNLPIHVTASGEVVVSDSAKIINGSSADIAVTSVELRPDVSSEWEVVSFDNDFSLERVNMKKVGFSINNDITDETGQLQFNSNNWSTIRPGPANALPINYSAKLPAQSSAITETSIGKVVFVVDWAN